MGRLILSTAVSVNGAFEAPSPDGWFVLDNDSGDDNSRQLLLSDAMLLGRKTSRDSRPSGRCWSTTRDGPLRPADQRDAEVRRVQDPQRAAGVERDAARRRARTGVEKLKQELDGDLYISGTGELAHTLTRAGLIDEFWFWVHPSLWADGPRVFEGVGPVRLELITATPYRSGVVNLRYRPA